MATDSTSAIAGKYPQRFPLRLTCILKEGNVTVVASGSAFDAKGVTAANYTFESVLTVGDIVALSNNVGNTYAATGGIPVVERGANTGGLIIGKIISTPDWLESNPTSTQTTWADMLRDKYYRVALVELWGGITKVEEAVVKSSGSGTVTIGVGTNINVNLADSYINHDLRLITGGSSGTGIIPFHYQATGTTGDEATILVGINGLLYMVSGA